MDFRLFSDRSLLTMLHGIVLASLSLLAMGAVLFHLYAMPYSDRPEVAGKSWRYVSALLTFNAVALWLSVLAAMYILFPQYRATPPEGTTDLAMYPRSLIQSNPSTVWLHSLGMEIKEHVPWIAAMLATAAAYVGTRYRGALAVDSQMRGMLRTFVAITFVLVSVAGLLGTFINKVAPLQ